MIMKIAQCIISVLMVMSALICSSCSSDEPAQNKERQEIPLSRSQKEYLDNETRFAFDFLKAVNQKELEGKNGNFVISPLSMARDLSMLACGASGNTLDQVLSILHLDTNASIEELNGLNKTLLDALLVADSKVTLNVNNSFWYGVDFPVKDSFMKTIKQNYNAPSTQVNFVEESTCNTINDWISKSTKGEMQGFFESMDFDNNIRFILLDAIYFRGNWSFTLKEEDTRPMEFYNHGTTATDVPTMNSKSFPSILGGDESVTMVKLPYGNEAYSMYIIMADEGYDINEVITEFDYERWKLLKETSVSQQFKFSFPKFEIEYKPDLEEALELLGLNRNYPLLENMQDFLVDPNPIDYLIIRQGNSIKVNETGSIITTTTVVAGAEYMSPPPPHVEYLHINRPFIFLVEEYSTGAILFAGKVVELY